jgi:thioredoxin 1
MKVFKFSASWCQPCKMLSKTLEGYDAIDIQEIDIDKEQEVAIRYGIRSVPTLVLFDDNGNEVRRKSGVMSVAEFDKFIKGE